MIDFIDSATVEIILFIFFVFLVLFLLDKFSNVLAKFINIITKKYYDK